MGQPHHVDCRRSAPGRDGPPQIGGMQVKLELFLTVVAVGVFAAGHLVAWVKGIPV